MSARDAAKIPKRIDSIRFTLMDPNEIRKMSSVEVKTADTYKDDGHAFKQGLAGARGAHSGALLGKCAQEN